MIPLVSTSYTSNHQGAHSILNDDSFQSERSLASAEETAIARSL